MTRKKIKFEIAEYTEKKELYEACGYQEIAYAENGIHCNVTFEIDNREKHYDELKRLAKTLKRKGPPFYPVFIFVFISFVLLSVFMVLLVKSIHHDIKFETWINVLTFLLPALLSLGLGVLYTILYFRINQRILLEGPVVREDFLKKVEQIKQK